MNGRANSIAGELARVRTAVAVREAQVAVAAELAARPPVPAGGDALVQTLFYGVFSAWVQWSREHSRARRAAEPWRQDHAEPIVSLGKGCCQKARGGDRVATRTRSEHTAVI